VAQATTVPNSAAAVRNPAEQVSPHALEQVTHTAAAVQEIGRHHATTNACPYDHRPHNPMRHRGLFGTDPDHRATDHRDVIDRRPWQCPTNG